MRILLFRVLFLFLLSIVAVQCTKTGEPGSSGDLEFMGPAGGSAGGGSGSGGGGTSQAGVITAGEWNDIQNWNFWMGLMDTVKWKEKQSYWKFFPTERYTVQLTNQQNKYIADAIVQIKSGNTILWTARTNQWGKAELFPTLFTGSGSTAYTATAKIGTLNVDLGSFGASKIIQKQLSVNTSPANVVDVMYIVDATGSMGDEIQYLKTELYDVLTRTGNELPGISIRTGSVFYRDEGDNYVTRPFAFSTNTGNMVDFIKNQNADGGGDFPEAVHSALSEAVDQQNWSEHAICRIAFLILDAPPHYNDKVIGSIQQSVKKAAEKGIILIPVTASGIDKETEFLMRFMAIATNGTYVFITNDSGIGSPHLSPTVGPYQVEYLNNLMVRLIKKYATIQ